jgi:GNAT superfamily N-acetyltransferase
MDQATTENAEACADCIDDSDIGRFYFINRDYTINLITSGINANEIVIAYTQNKTVVGFYWKTDNAMFCRFPYLRLFAVHPDYRSKGIGKQLLDHFEDQCFLVAPKLFLAVSDFNKKAQKFYSANGYSQVGKIQDLYKPGITELLFMKSRK